MMEFKTPDLTGPRYRPKVHTMLNKEFFDSFRKKYPRYKDVDNDTLKKIIRFFNKSVWTKVIDTRDGIQLPNSVGWIFIGTCDNSKKENIDYAKSKKYGIRVTNKNWETDGKLAKIFFTSFAIKHKMKNRELWKFVASRDFKRSVAKAYPVNWNTYIVVDPTKKLRLETRKHYYKSVLLKQQQEGLKDYNEFDL
jgi:hypothetical protein